MDRWKKNGKTLGTGGQAQVFVVTDQQGEHSGEYAMKVLSNPTRVARLDLEIAQMKSLVRTGCRVIPILDDYITSQPDADKPWYVMPIARGGNLASQLKPGEPYRGIEVKALEAFSEIVAVVRDIHGRQVAHRDLKPANILLHEGKFHVCDLGLCLPLGTELAGDRLTGMLERIGSIHYTPMEAFGRRPLDQNQYAFDAFALGKILYELLAGRVLPGFVSPNDPDFDLSISRGKPLYAAINAVLRGLLGPDPARRISLLAELPTQVSALIQWATEVETTELNESAKFKALAASASEQLARRFVATPPESGDPAIAQECEALAAQITAIWQQHPLLEGLRHNFVQLNPDLLEIRNHPKTAHLRQLTHGPFIRTKKALEPLEDLKYPERPTTESGSAIGIVPKGAPGKTMPEVWLGFLCAHHDGKLFVAFALVEKQAGLTGTVDIIAGTQRVFSGVRDDTKVIKAAVDHASIAASKFAETVLEKLTPKQ